MAPKRHYKEYLLNESSQPSKAAKYRRLAKEKENTLNCRGNYKKYLSASCTTNNREVLKEIPLSNNGERTYSVEEYPGDNPTTNKQPAGEGVSRKTHLVLELPPSTYSHCTFQFCGDQQDMQIGPEAQDMLEKQPGCNVPATPPDQQETPNQQAETFLLDGDDPAYPGAPLTKGQSLILLMSYVLRHNVTEASQLNIYGAPMRNVRKMALKQSDSSSPESGFRRSNPSPNMRQKRVDASANQSGRSAVNARKHFTLQGLSKRRSLPADATVKEAEVPRRFSLTSSLASSTSSSSFATRRTKGPLSASIKSKRHEIKSDPTPFGYEDTLRGAMATAGKRQSMTSSTTTTAGGVTTAVPRSTSQPGWTQRRLLSMDTEDFETIPSSAEESSNSSEDEGNNKNGDNSRFRVQLTYESREAKDLSLETGDMVQFLEEAENGN